MSFSDLLVLLYMSDRLAFYERDNLEKGMIKMLFFLNSVLRLFQDFFNSYETGQSVGRRKQESPEKNHLTHQQAKLGLSHMWPVQGSNPHKTQQ